MVDLNLPACDFRIRNIGDKTSIFDKLRRRYVTLTPEEWVRQHFVSFLISEKGYPAGRIGNEISLDMNNRKRRCDTIVYNSNGNPFVIIEYKAPHIQLSQEVFEQAARYNIALHVDYLILSNGMTHYCCKIDYHEMKYIFLEEIPFYNEL